MKEEEIKAVAEKAMMIVCGYAFSQTEEGFIRVVYLHSPYHALVMTSEGEVTETNMDDIEISIVQKYWKRNKKLMDLKSASNLNRNLNRSKELEHYAS